MLEIRPTCENCNNPLSFNSTETMISSFECTFCATCVETILNHVCPNCGGGFEKRSTRPEHVLDKYPVSKKVVYKPIDLVKHQALIKGKV